jgi:hypothetical protein
MDRAESKLYEVTRKYKRSSETAQSLVYRLKRELREIAGQEGTEVVWLQVLKS